ncbi:hypothetical protein TWF694_006874 [Orbilia ellipsospora]|uniref:Uncharacterized protein n=1 Tax=Orbilia ellipsospora TaxID=2528407 RepID=A0AAV9XMW4_9PEZI
MFLLIGAFVLLAGQVVAESCNCQCTLDNCVQALTGSAYFPPQTIIDDCRNLLWTHSYLASTTINVHQTLTISDTFTAFATSTVTARVNTTRISTVVVTQSATTVVLLTKTSYRTTFDTFQVSTTVTNPIIDEKTSVLTEIQTIVEIDVDLESVTATTQTSVTNTATENSISTTTSTVLYTVTESQTTTNTVTVEASITNTITEETTLTITSSTTETSQTTGTQTSFITDLASTTLTSAISTQIINSTTSSIVPIASVHAAAIEDFKLAKRQETLTSVPAYASSACANLAAYSSGCTCIGVTLGGTTYVHVKSISLTFVVTKHVNVTQTQVSLTTETITNDVNPTITVTENTTTTSTLTTYEFLATSAPTTVTATISTITLTTENTITLSSTIISFLLSTQTVTTVSTTTVRSTTTVVSGSTEISSSGALVTETATQFSTVTTTVTEDTTETATMSFTTTLISSVTLKLTDTTTLESTTISTIIQNTTVTSTNLIPEYTEFALQATNDDANGIFKGQWLKFFKDPTVGNAAQVLFTPDMTLALHYASYPDGNVTGPNTDTGPGLYDIPFAVRTGYTNLYELPISSSFQQVGCWVDSAYIFRCEGSGAKFMGATNSTGYINLYGDVGNIYTSSGTGPLVISAVPYPTASATTPPPAARSLVIQNIADHGTVASYIWQNNYFSTFYEDANAQGNPGTLPRVKMNPNKANARIFYADPATGNLLLEPNQPFVFNSGGTIGPVYTQFPVAATDTILGCTVHADLSITCQEGAFQYMCVHHLNGSANAGEVSIFKNPSDTTNVAWSLQLVAVYL